MIHLTPSQHDRLVSLLAHPRSPAVPLIMALIIMGVPEDEIEQVQTAALARVAAARVVESQHA